jgi:hypothetical protein
MTAKLIKLSFPEKYIIKCTYSNGEQRYLDLEKTIDKN